MDEAEFQEMLGMAYAAKDAGFPRVQIDPCDFIAVAEQRQTLLAALQGLMEAGVETALRGDGKPDQLEAIEAAHAAITAATGAV